MDIYGAWTIQANSLKPATRVKYMTTQLNFWEHCCQFTLHWHSSTMVHWLPYVAATKKGKILAASTLQQKVSHVNFLTTLRPPLLPGGEMKLDRLIQGLTAMSLVTVKNKVLPPSFLWRLHLLYKAKPIYVAMQVQAALGLRAGHFMLLKPKHFLPGSVMLPPFKKHLTSMLLPTHHVPQELLKAYLGLQPSTATRDDLVLPFWTPDQYKKLFAQATLELGLDHATHSARHTFASIQAALCCPRGILAAYLQHKDPKTSTTYIHELSEEELQCVNDHPEYFIPCSMMLAPATRAKLVKYTT